MREEPVHLVTRTNTPRRPIAASTRLLRSGVRLAGATIVLALLLWAVAPVAGRPSGAPRGGPIMLVTNQASPNVFGAYLGEILRAEGLSGFQRVDRGAVTDQSLAGAPLVLLAETPLTVTQAAMFQTYVSNGGQLIAMRPD